MVVCKKDNKISAKQPTKILKYFKQEYLRHKVNTLYHKHKVNNTDKNDKKTTNRKKYLL